VHACVPEAREAAWQNTSGLCGPHRRGSKNILGLSSSLCDLFLSFADGTLQNGQKIPHCSEADSRVAIELSMLVG